MIQSDSGIILRTRLLTETSLIVHWLSRSHGRISTVAKGARRSKSAFFGKLDVFYSAEFSYLPSRRSDLHTLREVRLLESRPYIRKELTYLQQAAYIAHLVEQTTESDSPIPEVYNLVEGFLASLPSAPPRSEMILAFELKLLSLLGLAPAPSETRFSPETAKLLGTLMDAEFSTLAGRPANAAPTESLVKYLHGFLIYQFGKLARGRESAVHPV